MKNSPWAKLISRTTPNMSARPAATIAYIEPRVSPWTSCSIRSSSISSRRYCRSAGLVGSFSRILIWPPFISIRIMLIQAWWYSSNLIGPERRLLHVDLLERVADALAVDLAVLLDGLLDGGHDGVLEGERGEAAVDAHRRLPALEPALLPLGIERGRPVGGLDHAVADRRVVLGELEELHGGHAAAGIDPLLEPELAELAEEHAGVAGQHDQEHAVGIGALELGQERPVVGLAAVEELGGGERDARLLEGGVVGGGGAAAEVVVLGDQRDRLHLLDHVAREGVGHDHVVDVDAELPLVAALARQLADLRVAARLGDLRHASAPSRWASTRDTPRCGSGRR